MHLRGVAAACSFAREEHPALHVARHLTVVFCAGAAWRHRRIAAQRVRVLAPVRDDAGERVRDASTRVVGAQPAHDARQDVAVGHVLDVNGGLAGHQGGDHVAPFTECATMSRG